MIRFQRYPILTWLDISQDISNFIVYLIYLQVKMIGVIEKIKEKIEEKIEGVIEKIEDKAEQAIAKILGLRSQKDQLKYPFRISNRDLHGIDRYLTVPSQPHATEQTLVAESYSKLNDEENESQLWFCEFVKKSSQKPHSFFFRIKNTKKLNHNDHDLYLTLSQSKHINQYLVYLAPQKQGNHNQLWSFELGQNLRFSVKIYNPIDKNQLYLESAQIENLRQDYKTVFVCRPKAEEARKCVQFWKLSPFETLPHIPQLKLTAEEHNLFVTKQCPEVNSFINRFKGKVYCKSSPDYNKMTEQYATSSYPRADTQPYLLAIPDNVDDIVEMIKFAKQKEKKIVARSGGHQYCGLSSGNQGTIVLSMDKFHDLKQNQKGLIEIGPCVRLKVAAKQFREWKISIPHGQCPLVNIGGHAQTGGYGWFIHSFGLCLDYIQAFDIVLADGSHRRVQRGNQQLDNIQLFRGVLGGNAGSFGIITKYIFKGIPDEDHPHAYGFSKTRLFNKDLMTKIMKIFQQWSIMIENHEDDQKLKGLDLQFTVGQLYIEFLGFKKPVLLFQGLYSDPDKVQDSPQLKLLKQIQQTFMEHQTEHKGLIQDLQQDLIQDAIACLDKFTGWSGQYPLSVLAQKHVRKFPAVTPSGREFDLPYKKRANVTMSALTDQFIEQFVDQVSYVASPKQKSVLVLVQMLFGGGAQRQKGKLKIQGQTVTSIPHRNFVHTFVFDIFYDDTDKNAQHQAERLQDQMQKTVDLHYSTPGIGEKRFFWASFDVPDMTKQSVINMYYDSHQDYAVLQQLKKKVDQKDLFHSEMTVKLPK